MAKILRDLADRSKRRRRTSFRRPRLVEAQAKSFGAEAEKLEKTESALVDQIKLVILHRRQVTH